MITRHSVGSYLCHNEWAQIDSLCPDHFVPRQIGMVSMSVDGAKIFYCEFMLKVFLNYVNVKKTHIFMGYL